MTARPSRLVLLGHPVRHSFSPRFQNAALRHIGVPLEYEALDVPPEELAARVRALVAERAAGNVTIPHKERVYALCARRTALAERAGAVNTFWVDDDGVLAGDNTDVGGFDALAAHVLRGPPRDVRVALLGAGGAAAAVLTAVERWPGCEVTLQNRSEERLRRLATRFPVVTRTTTAADEAVRGCALVVNATPVGLEGDDVPVPAAALAGGAAVADLVCRRGETAWVRAARARGHAAADGLVMLVEQGALAFERWLGCAAPREVMRRALACA
ncbi:MAG TPA: hypothetical protein VFS44_01310 [Gemmatimonadaceae bacterium]|nr:hypothetical protein [Gemmatimonadaceae bacterium]